MTGGPGLGRPEPVSADVVVVGAGLAGLTAAHRLAARGLDVVVLEARERVGGRTLNHDLGDGQVVEVGGQFVGPTQNRVLALAAELGVATFPAFDEGASVYVRDGAGTRYGGDIPPDPLALPGLGLAMARIDRAAARIPRAEPWQARNAAALDAITWQTWLRRGGAGRRAVALVDAFLASAFGATAAQVSALFGLHYVGGMGDETHPGTIGRGIAVAGGAQESRFVGGSQRLAELLAARLGDAVRLGAPVRRIEQDGTQVTVHAGEATVTARYAVVAVPPPLAAAVDHVPVLPAPQATLFRRLALGGLAKCEAVYDEPFWRADGLSGQAVFRDGPTLCSMFDNTPPSGRPGVLMGFLGGRQWERWSGRNAGERRGAVLSSFAAAVGRRALEPRAYLEHDWTAEPWTGGGPTSWAPPGLLTGLGRWRDVPHGRVHWAGAEHALYWTGYLDGAVRSGEDAAEAVLAAGGTRPA